MIDSFVGKYFWEVPPPLYQNLMIYLLVLHILTRIDDVPDS